MERLFSSRTDPPPFENGEPPWNDDPWEVFVPDEDQRDPLPEVGDFWTDDDGDEVELAPSQQRRREPQSCWH
ncbi:hypothetical protein [Bythopirellula goksoeyrii]|uniref:Uncharacterized protein n=1 Tax=Bythopirellula goksoeyrii TaxID=1400387 RepID=A0A5B9QJC2_9BACT|nr:hypothetical protein [Bythopirellula goksoeyrii]QEG37136.1 hypothetical protein Pr1d_44760 [Bythopirellula goksoeyrii]